MVIFDSTSTHSDSTDNLAILVSQGDSAWKGDESTIGVFDVVERPTGLRKPTDVTRIHVKLARCSRFFDADVDAAKPRSVHSQESPQVRARIDHCDIHPRVELFGPLHRGGERCLSLGGGKVRHKHRFGMAERSGDVAQLS